MLFFELQANARPRPNHINKFPHWADQIFIFRSITTQAYHKNHYAT